MGAFYALNTNAARTPCNIAMASPSEGWGRPTISCRNPHRQRPRSSRATPTDPKVISIKGERHIYIYFDKTRGRRRPFYGISRWRRMRNGALGSTVSLKKLRAPVHDIHRKTSMYLFISHAPRLPAQYKPKKKSIMGKRSLELSENKIQIRWKNLIEWSIYLLYHVYLYLNRVI